MRTPAAFLAAVLSVSATLLHAAPPEYAGLLGPALGHVGETQAAVWARAEKPGIYEIVSSPLGQNPHVNPNKPDPVLLFDKGSGRAFVSIEADSTVTPPVLTARWIDALGVNFYTLTINAGELSTPK